jgi:hypothetical protein
MFRRLFFLASLLSFLLCLATVVLWVRSYIVHDRVSYRDGTEVWAVTDTRSGWIMLGYRKAVDLPIEPGWSYVRWKAAAWESGLDADDFLCLHSYATLRGDITVRSVRSEVNAGIFVRETVGGLYYYGPGSPVVLATDASYWFIPFWVLACVFGVLGQRSVRRGVGVLRRLGRVNDPMRCVECRYNLTGNTSGVCPECGTAVAPKAGT